MGAQKGKDLLLKMNDGASFVTVGFVGAGARQRRFELDVEIGFGAAATDVPDVLRHAVRTLVAHWYENRGLIAIGQTVAMMPASVNAMIAAFRVRGL